MQKEKEGDIDKVRSMAIILKIQRKILLIKSQLKTKQRKDRKEKKQKKNLNKAIFPHALQP